MKHRKIKKEIRELKARVEKLEKPGIIDIHDEPPGEYAYATRADSPGVPLERLEPPDIKWTIQKNPNKFD